MFVGGKNEELGAPGLAWPQSPFPLALGTDQRIAGSHGVQKQGWIVRMQRSV